MVAEEVIGLLFGVEGGTSIDKGSGKRISNEIAKIVDQINGDESRVPKIVLNFDASKAKDVIKSLEDDIKRLEKLGKITVTNRNASGKSGKPTSKSDADALKAQNKKYQELSSSVKEYYKNLKAVEKIELKSKTDRSDSSTWGDKTLNYTKQVELLNQLEQKYGDLKVVEENCRVTSIASAKELGISEEQRLELIQEIQEAVTNLGVASEKSSNSIQMVWQKNSDKARTYVNHLRDIGSTNEDVVKLADDVEKLAMSGDSKNLDELTKKMAELQKLAHEKGADIETFGHKLQKAFGASLRSALVGIITTKIAQYIKEIYTNVVKLDEALVNLQIASGKTREETRALLKEYSQLAKQLGATTSEVAEAADTWLRQGYSAEEANTLIANSMMLAKLGQMDSEEAATALTSAMKGYNIAVEDSIGIVDKFTKVDMEAAASAGDIATAMAETATSANVAGVSMDKLIGYITVVKEVTQDGAESVGNFYKTLFARMNNVAAGNFVDEETGESLNDVETVLNELGIALRDVNGEFRNSDNVLDEVASKWETFDSVAQHAIATAFAGTRNQEKFLTLMQHYDTALEYTTVAMESSGTAAEKYEAVLDGIEGKTNALKAAFEELSMTVINADWVVTGLEWLTKIVELLTAVSSVGDGVVISVLAVSAAILVLNAAFITAQTQIKKTIIQYANLAGVQVTDTITTEALTAALLKLSSTGLLGVITFIPRLIAAFVKYIVAKKSATMETITFNQSLQAMNITLSATKIAIGSVIAVLAILVTVYSTQTQKINENIQAHIAASEAAKEEADEYKGTAESVKELIQQYEELAATSDGVLDSAAAETARKIQDQITDLVGDQAKNLDLVNGKLDDEIRKLREIASVELDYAEDKANEQMTDATLAYREKVDTVFNSSAYTAPGALGHDGHTNYLFGLFKSDNISDVTQRYTEAFGVDMDSLRVGGNLLYDAYSLALRSQYDDIADFATQYERIAAMKTELAQEHGDSDLYAAASEYLTEFEDVYNAYASAKVTLDNIASARADSEDSTAGATDALTVSLKSALTILEKVQDGYDGLTKALSEVDAQGYLTADGLSTLLQLEKDNVLGGLELADILTQDENGYKLATDAVQKYVQALITQYETQYWVGKSFASEQDRENAIANLKTLQAVLMTLVQIQEDAADAADTERDNLEKQQDILNDQLDAYRDLIDIRKDLLQSYEDEVTYQKELARRQQNVSSLQAKLAIARLDTSAAGQARVRELEAELREAEEDLEDFTLEHAIDVLVDQLENEQTEYEQFIQRELDAIEAKINALDTTVNLEVDTSWVQEMLSQIATLISKVGGVDVDSDGDGGGGTGGSGDTTNDESNTTVVIPGSALVEQRDNILKETLGEDNFQTIDAILKHGTALDPTLADYKQKLVQIHEALIADNKKNGRDENYWVSAQQWLAPFRGGLVTTDISVAKASYETLKKQYEQATGTMCTYHTGGFVGGISALASNEEFAKLLKGEFVSTPAQMKRFMEDTLPQIANYSPSSSSNEFNAPLIEIHCDSVTSESLPELKTIVNQAVKEIQKQLDSGMSRAGYKKTPSKRLT